MPSVQVRFQVSFDELLKGVAQLDVPELERFVSRVLVLRAQRLAPSLAKEESRLLEKINQGLSPAAQKRYEELTAKGRAEELTSGEHQELLERIDGIELADAERLRALAALAQLRDVSVDALMADLGIRSPGYA